MKTSILALLVCGLALLDRAIQAAPLQVGDAVPKISAKDQHGKDYNFTNGTTCLLIALDRDSAKAANHQLAEQGAGFLEKQGAVYLMDIHTMPAIGRFFALPKMRKYPQRIVLIDSADSLNWVPVKPEHVTVLKLTPEGRVERISFWQPANEPVTDLFK